MGEALGQFNSEQVSYLGQTPVSTLVIETVLPHENTNNIGISKKLLFIAQVYLNLEYLSREKDLFRMLIGISGIGPKTAINMLSAVHPLEFRNRLIAGEVKMLTALPGIGPKTARRIIVELKDQFGEFDKEELPLEESLINDDAFYALKKLGFSPKIIRDKIIEIQNKNNALDTEEIIKEALKSLND